VTEAEAKKLMIKNEQLQQQVQNQQQLQDSIPEKQLAALVSAI
jgi:hypothetical protein